MPNELDINHDTLVEIYRQMSRIHEVDKAIQSGLSSGKFQFTYWPMTGQECIPASIAPHGSDKITKPVYRNHCSLFKWRNKE